MLPQGYCDCQVFFEYFLNIYEFVFCELCQRTPRLLNLEMNGILKWWISNLSIREDHVHLIIQTKPSDSIAEVVQRLKGGTSRVIRKDYPELEEFLWVDRYFAETVGNVDEEVVRRYIREQRR